MPERPNILYLHSHDTGRYIQPYGHAVPAPHLQELAEQGTLFRQAFCVSPSCSASRACLLTGQFAHNNGMLGLSHRGFFLNDYTHHILHTLRKAGYTSTLVGVQHIASGCPERIGYDQILQISPTQRKGSGQSATTETAVNFLKSAPDRPFFLATGYNVTHRVFPEPGPGEDPRYCRPPDPLPDTPETRRDMAAFKASARILDDNMGAVIRALDETGLGENTLVICTTDHGIAFPYMKCNLTDHGTGVMLIMRGPGGFNGGKVCDALVSQVDIFPTLCDLLGIDPPEWLQGKSMMPFIRGETDEINGEIFTEVTYHAAYEPMRAVRTVRWKYIRRFDGRDRPVLPNCDDSPSKDVWMAHGWRDRPVAQEQLYDLIFDPNEANNLANDPAMADVLQDMRRRLDRWMRDTDDPLLKGPVPLPPGARANDPDGASPREEPKPA